MRSPHNYRQLVARWRAVARKSGVPLRRLTSADGQTLFYMRTPALEETGGIYISAAIHGDEPAASEALIEWAEKNVRRLAKLPLLLFPALNPWGLINNIRLNGDGIDLNRLFHRDDHPVIRAIKGAVGQRQFSFALMLHEDYDAEGFYVYEIKRDEPFWGEALLETAGKIIPIDRRKKIDGRSASDGLIRRKFQRALFERIGFPEAIWLHEFHARRALTIESPSEFAIEQRVRVHREVLAECMRLAGF